ncbi:hypothetical protein CXB51_010891 [Gossypium anomalum]|uniref:Integrase catalytic domain-containing protein n=1 Tax=Gossypium anomalum TaxID=47600 RepID=A0A8J6D6Z8_9ROSI|nr:hypothetical protein CXB51_010891 [Gossypium anomalum]
MATETIPDAVSVADTPRHSSSPGEAVHSHGSGSLCAPAVHYFSKHDTIKLADHNFLLWKHHLLLILEGYGLEGFVLGTVPSPSPFIVGSDGQQHENLAFLVHKKQDKFLASWLLSTVTDDILAHVTTAKTSFDIWTTIERRFSAKSTIKVLSMRHALYSLKKANLSVKEYVSKVKHLSDNLTAAGSFVYEQEQVSVILAGLSLEFESIRVFACATPLSLDLLTEMLLDCEARQLEVLTEAPCQANFASRQPENNDGPEGKVKVGLAPGHSVSYVVKLDIWFKLVITGLMRTFLVLVQLTRCQSTTISYMVKTVLLLAHLCLIAAGHVLNLHPVWYPDSGATNHITPDMANLATAFPYPGTSQVSMGDGASLSIAHIGSSHFMVGSRLLRLQTVLHVLTDIQTKKTLLVGHMHKGLYRFDFSRSSRDVSDVWGPAHVQSNGFSYYVSFVDVHSRYTWLYFLKSKSEELSRLGIHHKITCPHTSEQNGVAERRHRQIVEMGLPTLVLHHISPYENLFKYQPVYSQLKTGFSYYSPVESVRVDRQQSYVPLVLHSPSPSSPISTSSEPLRGSPVTAPVSSNSSLPTYYGSSEAAGTSVRSTLPTRSGSSEPADTLAITAQLDSSTRDISTTNLHPMQTQSKSGVFKPKVFSSVLTDKEPSSISEAFQSPLWTAAARAEYDALILNHAWDLMPLPAGCQAVDCKWIFKVKRNSDGSVARYKGRLVVKGYLQEASVDFPETFSPVVKPTTIRLVLALAVSLGWSLRQPGGQQLVCKMRKSLYGLKQAPRVWFYKLKEFLLEAKFQASKADSSFFIQKLGSIVLLHLWSRTNSQSIDKFVTKLNDRLSLKDLGRLNYFLGIEVTYSSNGVFLSQQKYIQDLLRRASMDKSNSSPTPMVSTCHLSNHEGSPIEDEHLFRSIVGALQYVVITRLDIAFAVNKVCQFMHKPLDPYFKAIKRILHYLQGTLSHGLQFTRSGKVILEGYSDASWGSDSDDRRSTSGFCVFFGAEIIWIQSLLSELSAPVKVKALVWCDSSAAIAVASNPIMHSKFNHVKLDLFFVREKVAEGSLQVGHVSSQDQVADILTKPFSIGLFSKFRSQLRVVSNDRITPSVKGS